MTIEANGDTRRKILFLSFLLGLMVVLALFLAFAAVQRDKPALIAVILPMGISSIPLARALAELRKAKASSSETDVATPGPPE